jgi:hypothetical protein
VVTLRSICRRRDQRMRMKDLARFGRTMSIQLQAYQVPVEVAQLEMPNFA